MLYPDIERIREVSVQVAMQVIRKAQELEVDRNVDLRQLDDKQLEHYIRSKSYHPLIDAEEVRS